MDFKNQSPIFIQIADLIMNAVLSGQLKTGDRIESVREMAAKVQVNPNTVHRAFAYLQDRGIIFNQRGVGYFVDPEALNRTQALKKKEFMDQYLPEFVKRMKLLDLKPDDLKKYF